MFYINCKFLCYIVCVTVVCFEVQNVLYETTYINTSMKLERNEYMYLYILYSIESLIFFIHFSCNIQIEKMLIPCSFLKRTFYVQINAIERGLISFLLFVQMLKLSTLI